MGSRPGEVTSGHVRSFKHLHSQPFVTVWWDFLET